jgi:hypothetical protein
MLELIAGVVVAFVAVWVVMQPLLGRSAAGPSGGAKVEVEFEELEESASPKVQALLALKEIEFDRATGKLSDEDYEQLKAKYSQAALGAIKAEEHEAQGGGSAEDAAEDLVRMAAEGKLAVCPKCGPRPEAEAAFCSDCGTTLTKPEPKVEAPAGARRFCEACGNRLTQTAKFCDACGAKVGVVPATSAS